VAWEGECGLLFNYLCSGVLTEVLLALNVSLFFGNVRNEKALDDVKNSKNLK